MFEGKKLGFGLMRLPLTDANDKGSIDIEALKEMVDTFMEQGFTYFDTAWMYCAFKSENAVKEALTDRYPRDRYTLTTKLHASYLKTKEDRDRIFEEQRQKTGVDYFDYYLIHAIDQELYSIYNEMDCFNWLIEKKKQGLVKHIGFSYHRQCRISGSGADRTSGDGICSASDELSGLGKCRSAVTQML